MSICHCLCSKSQKSANLLLCFFFLLFSHVNALIFSKRNKATPAIARNQPNNISTMTRVPTEHKIRIIEMERKHFLNMMVSSFKI